MSAIQVVILLFLICAIAFFSYRGLKEDSLGYIVIAVVLSIIASYTLLLISIEFFCLGIAYIFFLLYKSANGKESRKVSKLVFLVITILLVGFALFGIIST